MTFAFSDNTLADFGSSMDTDHGHNSTVTSQYRNLPAFTVCKLCATFLSLRLKFNSSLYAFVDLCIYYKVFCVFLYSLVKGSQIEYIIFSTEYSTNIPKSRGSHFSSSIWVGPCIWGCGFWCDISFVLDKGKEVADCVETHGCGHQLWVLLLA